jgi:carnitine O-acetyltransferase
MDGTPTLRMNEFILASIAKGKVDFGTETATESLPEPQELEFQLNDKVKGLIKESERRFDELVGQHDMEVLHFDRYGKDYIKKFKASPDAWAQLVKQLAFHKMFGRPGVCYESAQTRKYQRGRTEVIRSASNESKAWAEAMLSPKETVRMALFS